MSKRRKHLDVRPLVRPKSVAVVGASENVDRYPGKIMSSLIRFGFDGAITAVNPKYDEVFGYPCVPSFEHLADPADVALIAVSAKNTLDVLEEAATSGSRAAVLYASGFGEASETGSKMQAEIPNRLGGADMIVLGPNTLGAINCTDRVVLSGAAALSRDELKVGGVGLVTQSGGMMGSILDRGWDRGVGFTFSVATGNEAQVYASDFIAFLAEDPETKVIAMFLEGVKDVDLFVDACAKARQAGKDLVVLKVGRSESGKKTAASHTGAIAGSEEGMNALFQQCGVIQVQTVDDLIGVSHMLVAAPVGTNPRVAVAALSGGLAGLAADSCGDENIELAELTDATTDVIAQLQFGFGHASNPLDITGQVVSADTWATTTTMHEALLADPNVDALVVALPTSQFADRSAVDVARVAAASTKPVVAVWTGGSAVSSAIRDLRNSGVPTFDEVGDCFRAMSLVSHQPDFTGVLPGSNEPFSLGTDARIQELIEGAGGLLDDGAAFELVNRFEIGVPRYEIVDGPELAGLAADRIGYPVALKVVAEGLAHKSDVGGVHLGLGNRESVVRAATDVMATLDASQVMVCEMVPDGVEILLGMTRDSQVGPLVVVGLGGTFVELMRDTVVMRPPVGVQAAMAGLERLKGSVLFGGYRGRPPVNIGACAEAVVRFSDLVETLGSRLTTAEINPLIVGPERATAVDVLVELSPNRV